MGPCQNYLMTIVYGISNCDTVKSARAWLTAHAQPHNFHDFKKSGVPSNLLPLWIHAIGTHKLINRQGTTWRKLDIAAQNAAIDDAGAIALMIAQPRIIKRPVVDWGGGIVTVGFEPAIWSHRLSV